MLQFSFIIITLLSLIFLYLATGRNKKILLLFTTWQLVSGGLALAGVFERIPYLLPFAIVVTVMLTIFCLQKIDRQKLDLKFLLAIHVVRIPVELTLYQLYLQKKVPALMTFSGWNFDIIMGISALILLLLVLFSKKQLNKKLFIVWNIVGLLFLLTIVLLAILSSPLPIQQFAFKQPNIAVLLFPFSFLPTCVVPTVFLSHILLINSQQKSYR